MTNIYKRTVRCTAGVMIGILVVGMLAGCANKQEDITYVSEEQGDNSDYATNGNSTGEVQTDGGNLDKFREEKKWTDSWSVALPDRDMTVGVDARIEVIDAAGMSVVECEYIPFDENFKQKVVEGFFGEGDVYHYELPYRSQEQVVQAITYLKERIAEIDSWIEAGILDSSYQTAKENAQKELDACIEARNNGTNEYELITDYSGTAYWGEKDGVAFAIEFLENEQYVPTDGYRELMIYPIDSFERQGTNLQQGDILIGSRGMKLSFDEEENKKKNETNACIYSQQEAVELAQDTLADLGLSNQELVQINELQWVSYNLVGEYLMEVVDEEKNGYVCFFATPIDEGVYAPELCTERDYLEKGIMEAYEREPYEQHTLVYVDSAGVACVNIQNPIEMQRRTENVALLSMDSIKGVVKAEIDGRTDFYGRQDNVNHIGYQMMKLEYFRMENELDKDSFTYIPMWHLYCAHNDIYDVYINAMDGTAIDYNYLHWDEEE